MPARDATADRLGAIVSNAPTYAAEYSASATNMVAQIAAGSIIDSAGPFTVTGAPRTARIVVGAGGVATVYTITGTDAESGGAERTETINATGAGTFEGNVLWSTVTRLQSNVDPQGTTDLQNSAQGYVPATQSVYIGTTGDLTGSPLEPGNSEVTWANMAVGTHKIRLRYIALATTASDVVAER